MASRKSAVIVASGAVGSNTDTGLLVREQAAQGCAINACASGDDGDLILFYVFEDGEELQISTHALADGVLTTINFVYKVNHMKVYYKMDGAGTLRVDVTSWS